jgi:hypothetical protein
MTQITEKILFALAGTTSVHYLHENGLKNLGVAEEISNTIEKLLADKQIVTCRITKDGKIYSVYWLACQVIKPKHYSEVFTPELREAKKARDGSKDRHCSVCNTAKPVTSFSGRGHRCISCLKVIAEKKTNTVIRTKGFRWCTGCKKEEPISAFSSPNARRCMASVINYAQNRSAILAEKQRLYRAKKREQRNANANTR